MYTSKTMELGRSKEELVVEEKRNFMGQSKVKWLIAIAVVLTVMTILFIGLYASERQKLKDAESKTAATAAKGLPVTTVLPPGTDVTADSVQVAASKYHFRNSNLYLIISNDHVLVLKYCISQLFS